jgi:hypothetical protein
VAEEGGEEEGGVGGGPGEDAGEGFGVDRAAESGVGDSGSG